MGGGGTYRDVRAESWRSWFARALPYDGYLAGSDERKAARWRELESKLPPLDPDRRARLEGIGRELNVLVVSGVWCGDCVRQGPMIRQLAEACGGSVSLRLIDRDLDPALRDEVRILGAMRVPVVVFLSEDFFEVGRFGDRMLATYRKKALRELGPACPLPGAVPPCDELAAERDEWCDVFERMLLMARLAPPLRERHGD
jgi:thiol-disulfide isomerase/thioredoxin